MARIFFIEATIFRLQIDERIIDDADGDKNFKVKIDLIDIPSLVIHRNDSFKSNESRNNNCEKKLDYYAGRACHFVAKQREIVNSLRRKPLRIGIYRADERFPICHGVVPFSGCVCDLVSKAIEEPSPFEFRGDFNLIDPGGNSAGHASLGIILVDLGELVVTLFALARESFVLKNDPEGAEYACGELKNSHVSGEENYSPLTIDECCTVVDYSRENFMRDVAGISFAAGRLSRGKPEVKKMRQPLNVGQEKLDGSGVKPGIEKRKKLVKKTKKKTK